MALLAQVPRRRFLFPAGRIRERPQCRSTVQTQDANQASPAKPANAWPGRRLTDRYSKDSYRRVIVRAVGRANRVIQEDAEHMGIEARHFCRPGTRINSGIRPQPRYEETLAWRLPRLSWAIPRRIRREIYAERDAEKAIKIVNQIG